MAPNTGGAPKDTLASVISRDFGSYENFVTTLKVKQLNNLALLGFGWLLTNLKTKGNKHSKSDNPLMKNAVVPGTPYISFGFMGTCLLPRISIPKKLH
jgi:Fe-Mn family superoxide dismutase